MEDKLHLADAIDYARDIEPYQFIQIRSGVGSGKNYFIDRLIGGGYFKYADGTLVPPQHILLITSRNTSEANKKRPLLRRPVKDVRLAGASYLFRSAKTGPHLTASHRPSARPHRKPDLPS